MNEQAAGKLDSLLGAEQLPPHSMLAWYLRLLRNVLSHGTLPNEVHDLPDSTPSEAVDFEALYASPLGNCLQISSRLLTAWQKYQNSLRQAVEQQPLPAPAPSQGIPCLSQGPSHNITCMPTSRLPLACSPKMHPARMRPGRRQLHRKATPPIGIYNRPGVSSLASLRR